MSPSATSTPSTPVQRAPLVVTLSVAVVEPSLFVAVIVNTVVPTLVITPLTTPLLFTLRPTLLGAMEKDSTSPVTAGSALSTFSPDTTLMEAGE